MLVDTMAADKDAIFKLYYTRFFPYKDLFSVLSINECKEMSFARDSNTYMRYETFSTAEEFYDRICQVNPFRIDIGATYEERPSKLLRNVFAGKELIFDVDLTDYDRECCKAKTICPKCYEIIKCTVDIMNYILKVEFGFEHCGFIFSGRRGVHCWVLGEDSLKTSVRGDIVKYFEKVIADKDLTPEYDKIISKYTQSDKIKWFPRIDKQVTVNANHLIKMPFSIHPDTMNVSVPLDPNNIKEYNDLPTVYDFIDEKENIEEYVQILRSWGQ